MFGDDRNWAEVISPEDFHATFRAAMADLCKKAGIECIEVPLPANPRAVYAAESAAKSLDRLAAAMERIAAAMEMGKGEAGGK